MVRVRVIPKEEAQQIRQPKQPGVRPLRRMVLGLQGKEPLCQNRLPACVRSVEEWLGLFDDPILGNSALDRQANGAHRVVIEGSTYRAKLAPDIPAAPAS
jgi:hypothetical protein